MKDRFEATFVVDVDKEKIWESLTASDRTEPRDT